MYNKYFKRIFDLVLATMGLTLLSPIFLTVALWLAFANRGTPFFLQERPGKEEKLFKIIKFKSMNDDREANGKLLPDKDRITKVGGFVRKTSLDEIPQLINVLKGDMSLVGPRPLLSGYLPYYTKRERLRHTVRPGITGLAQISGRNSVTWDDKLELDATYVEALSFFGDIKILFSTVLGVVKRKDVNTVPSQSGVLLSFARQNLCFLRPLEKQDLDFRVDWINDPRIHNTMNIQTPITLKGTEEWFERNHGNANRRDFTLIWSNQPVAMAGVSKDDGMSEVYVFVDPNLKGCGLGTLAQFLCLAYVFDVMKIDRVKAVIDSNNLRSKRLFEKLGFVLIEVVEAEIIKKGMGVDRCHYFCESKNFSRHLFGHIIRDNAVHYTHTRHPSMTSPRLSS